MEEALNIWATHLYYENLDVHEFDVSTLPLDVFDTVFRLIEERQDWQLQEELSDLYPHGTSKTEILATLQHLYSKGKSQGKRREAEGFVHLVSQGGHIEEDLELIRGLILTCESPALEMQPASLSDLVAAIDRAFCNLDVSNQPFTAQEHIYVQLHLLVCFHNVLFDVDPAVFEAITNIELPERQAMLSVSAMDSTLSLDVAFYFHEDDKYLEQDRVRASEGCTRFGSPVVSTELDEQIYLVEKDRNIRACLYNHPLAVRRLGARAVIVALERKNARFKPTRRR